MAVKVQTVVSWVVTQCRLVGVYQNFRGTYCCHLEGGSTAAAATTTALKMEATCSSKIKVTTKKTTWCHNPEDHNLTVTELLSTR
jgi:hypothetical protein